MIGFFSNVLRGVAVGLANIIPGVSGGTMLLILGVYERVIHALRNIDVKTVLGIFKGKKSFIESMKKLDALFMTGLAAGAVVTVVAMAKLMGYLLNKHHDPTYGFFFGLVLASVIVPWRMIKAKSVVPMVAAVLGAVAVVGLTFAVSAERKIKRAESKIARNIHKAQLEAAAAAGGADKVKRPPKASTSGAHLALFAGAGAIAIAAMILPGISGSFMLLMMGVYFELLAAINSRNYPLLGVFMLGCLVGLLLFTRLLNYLLEKHHDVTIGFLLGLVVGSLWAIWPFKEFKIVGAPAGLALPSGMDAAKLSLRVDLGNTLPAGFSTNEILTLATVVAGCVIVGIFVWLEARNPTPPVQEKKA
ncbi:MAG: DUF368 domain-containing protein [Myxococcales bacterium]|nr:DUF368 domain-containing protein [Myxococcales bacterium]